MARLFRPSLILLLSVALLAATDRATATGPGGLVQAGPAMGANPNVGIDEQIGAQVPLDLVFRDESEQPVTLGEAMQGKVTILVPIYFRCPMLCNQVLNNLVEELRKFPPDFSVGGAFNVVAVSMDPKEHADLGHLKKKTYVDWYGRPGADAGWRFLTGKKEAINTLLTTVGYRYEFDKAFKEYNHPSGVIILTAGGKVSRYFHGIAFDGAKDLPDVTGADGVQIPGGTTTLRLSLVEAGEGKIGSLKDKLLLTCYRFDNKKGYGFQITRAVQIGGLLTLFAVVAWVTFALRRERRKPDAGAATTTPNTTDTGATPTGGTA